jgi:hypothetical protein
MSTEKHYESNWVWVPISFLVSTVLTVVTGMKHDIRWLLPAAWLVAQISFWKLSKSFDIALSIVFWLISALLLATALWALAAWLSPSKEEELGPYCYLALQAVVGNRAFVAINNPTKTAVEDVQANVMEVLGTSEDNDGKPHTLGWQGTIKIGTSRAKLFLGLEPIPFDSTQNAIFYHIFLMTRNETFIEKISLRKASRGQPRYLAHFALYRGENQSDPIWKYDNEIPLHSQP